MSDRPLHYTVDGPTAAPPLLLLHPIATHSGLWAPQMPVWSRTRRVVRVDLPGHGQSAAPAGPMTMAAYADGVCAVLDELKIVRTAVLGLSLGGMVAQAVAIHHAPRVSALVLAHTSARTEAPVREIWDRRLDQFEQRGMQGQLEPTLERWFTRSFANASPLTLAWVGEQIVATAPAGYLAAVRAIQSLDHLDALRSLRVPTLVIAGEADAAVPPAAAERLAQAVPGAEFFVLEDAAHIGNVQQPVAFTEAVGRFLDNMESRS